VTKEGARRPLFGVGTTVILVLLLVVPFVLRTLSSSAEPYPAVLLPAGPGQVPVSHGTAGFSVRSIVGRRPTGSEAVLDPVTFLAPIPVHYLYALADGQFGQDAGGDRTISSGRLGITFSVPRAQPTASSKAEARDWLRSKLSAAGLAPDTLIIRDEWVTVQLRSGRELTRSVQNEITVDLR
jgi:hypothetical protein